MLDTVIRYLWLAAVVALAFPGDESAAGFPLEMTDTSQQSHTFRQKPHNVICLAPYITEMLVKFGQADAIVGLTRQDLILNAGLRKKNMGSVFAPDPAAIAACSPDLIIATPYQEKRIRSCLKDKYPVMVMEAATLNQAFSQMHDLGRLFDCEQKADQTVEQIKAQLSLVAKRLAHVQGLKKKRVVRVMAGSNLSCPGDDSFQNEMIKAAGGIVPEWGKKGFAVQISPEEWQNFNPQVTFGCHDNAEQVKALLKQDGFKNVAAVQNGFISMFPCDLTCQASTRVGEFVQWLSAVLYPEVFADPDNAVTQDEILSKRNVTLSLDYVETAKVVNHRLADSIYKSLVLRFKNPQTILSTFEGKQEGIKGCGNTFIPMAASLGHMTYGVERVKKTLEQNLGFSSGQFATLMTGADMDNLAVVEKSYKDLKVTALVTAGVKGNAMRMSKDTGTYFSHGTINIIIGTNRRLSVGAMARAIITVTEAKTASLLDLDIRSSYTPLRNKATGTGTDNVLVIQGEGRDAAFAGGHGKIAELMAKAVHEGVTQAVSKQNGLLANRDIYQRLSDRKMSLEAMAGAFSHHMKKNEMIAKLQSLLSDPYYAAFVESALALSDAREKGLIKGTGFWDETCTAVIARISKSKALPAVCKKNKIPREVAKAFGALISGIEILEGQNK